MLGRGGGRGPTVKDGIPLHTIPKIQSEDVIALLPSVKPHSVEVGVLVLKRNHIGYYKE